MAKLALFLLRLVLAVCSAPLVVGWLVGAAYLDARVFPSTLLYLLLTALGVGLAVLIGILFLYYADDLGTELSEGFAGAAGFTSAVMVVATIAVAPAWAFGSIAEERTCVVTERGSEESMSAMDGGTRSAPLMRVRCADGLTDTVGGSSPPWSAHAWRFWAEGDEVRVAYDPGASTPPVPPTTCARPSGTGSSSPAWS
jgi:hypothetical protein